MPDAETDKRLEVKLTIGDVPLIHSTDTGVREKTQLGLRYGVQEVDPVRKGLRSQSKRCSRSREFASLFRTAPELFLGTHVLCTNCRMVSERTANITEKLCVPYQAPYFGSDHIMQVRMTTQSDKTLPPPLP